MYNLLLVALGGALGSICRYLISTSLFRSGSFIVLFTPTLLVNVIGSTLIGILAAIASAKNDSTCVVRFMFFAIYGFCGGFTTFSSFIWENVKIFNEGAIITAALNIICSILFSLCGFVLFYYLTIKIIKLFV